MTKTCPSCGDPLPEGSASSLGTCKGSGACIRIERFRRRLAGEPDPFTLPQPPAGE